MEPTEQNPEPRKRFTQLCKLIIDRGAKAIQWGERAAFPHMVPEQLGIHRPEKTNKQTTSAQVSYLIEELTQSGPYLTIKLPENQQQHRIFGI